MQTILVPVDFSEVTEAVTALAGRLARALGAKVVVMHVAQGYLEDFTVASDVPVPTMSREMLADQLKQWRQQLRDLAGRLERSGCRVEPLMVEGPIVARICEEVSRRGADLVVMGSHGHGQLHDILMGSVSKGVIRKAGVPVLVVPCKGGEREGARGPGGQG